MEDFTEAEGASLLDGPIPGEGLTSDPQNPKPWEKAPEYTELEVFIDDLFLNITSEDNLDGVLDPLRKGVPIEDAAQLLLFQAFSTGKISTDLMMSAIEPTVYLLIGLASFAEIEDPVLYPEDDMMIDEDAEIKALEEAGSAEPEEVSIDTMPVPEGVSQSLVSKLKQGDI